VADHMRSTTFLIADGVIPSNEWRGYVLRKIMRRAMRHGKHLGFEEPFLHALVGVLGREMGDAYPELRRNREMIEKTILAEEHRFEAVLTEGLPRLEAELNKVFGTKSKILSGETAFRLYDTFGIPYDFIEDTAATHGVQVDRAAYDAAMEAQRHKARAGSVFGGGKKDEQFAVEPALAEEAPADTFEGYTTTRVQGVPIVALWNAERQPTPKLSEGEEGYVALGRTPFYVEAGGQVSDSGRISAPRGAARVLGLRRTGRGLPRAHQVHVESGELSLRDLVTAEVDEPTRDATRRNHTATHLLHAALRQVLGPHVKQAGSLVAPDRLRFDFVHFQPLTQAEIDRIEQIVNDHIKRNIPVDTTERSTEEAIADGAMALFGEKYGDRVRVVSVPGFSMELCGGTHVRATGDIGLFLILAENGVAAGVRRVEAVTGDGAVRWAQQQRASLKGILDVLHTTDEQAVGVIERLHGDLKRLTREVSALKTRLAMGGGPGDAVHGADDAIDIAGVKLARRQVADLDKDALRALADSLKAKIKSGVVVLASATDGKVQIVVAVTSDLTGRIKAGQIVKDIAPIVGGGGGGRPDFAEAGGRHPEKIDQMLQAAEQVVAKLLGA
jgi:alanyl-tRNA synthetase